MTCKLRQRKDDIPKRNKKEKTWACDACGAIMFAERKPVCRKVMLAQVEAMHAFADGEAAELHLDEKTKP